MGRRIPQEAVQWPQVMPDRPVVHINWPRVAFAGLLAATTVAILTILVTLKFQTMSADNPQPVSGGPSVATEVSSAPKAYSSPTLQLVAEPVAQGTDHRLPLGIFVGGSDEIASAAAIEIIGLPDGWTLSAGWPFGNRWRIPAPQLSGAVILAPRDFSGAIDLGAELRLANDTLVARRLVRRVRIDPELATQETVLLLRIAENLLDARDITGARLVLQRAAEAGNARAALMLGETYDGCLLYRLGCSVDADRDRARSWYQVAEKFGSTDARRRLDRLARDEPGAEPPSR